MIARSQKVEFSRENRSITPDSEDINNRADLGVMDGQLEILVVA
jgi:hypothetical protein